MRGIDVELIAIDEFADEYESPAVDWRVTTSEYVAFGSNYIGEVLMTPNPLAKFIGEYCGRYMPTFKLYYYGNPDERLKKLFGYKDGK